MRDTDFSKLGSELCGSALLERVARKSRSLEDILNSPVENGVAAGSPRSQQNGGMVIGRLPSAVEILGPSTCSDIGEVGPRSCWGVVPGQNHDGASGSGSLHGSAEIIQVS